MKPVETKQLQKFNLVNIWFKKNKVYCFKNVILLYKIRCLLCNNVNIVSTTNNNNKNKIKLNETNKYETVLLQIN